MFTHLSKLNPYHIYSIDHDKIIRDDFRMSFSHPNLIKADYIKLPELHLNEVRAIIIELRKDERFIDMARGFAINISENWEKIRIGENTERVKELLKFIKREDKGVYL